MEFQLLRTHDQQHVTGTVCKLSGRHIDDFQSYWLPNLSDSDEQDRHWNWAKKFIASAGKLNYELYALECTNPGTQGLMMIDLDLHRSKLEHSRNLVYVEFLAIAPWNRRRLMDSVQYKGVGVALLTYAVVRSFEMEYAGRIGLHSLSWSENFYTKFGMTLLNNSLETENLKYFELSREKAKEIINRL